MTYNIEDIMIHEGVEWVVMVRCETFYIITRKGVDRKKLTSDDVVKVKG